MELCGLLFPYLPVPPPVKGRALTWLPSLPLEAWPPWSPRFSWGPVLSVGCSAHILGYCGGQGHSQHTGHQPYPGGLHDVTVGTYGAWADWIWYSHAYPVHTLESQTHSDLCVSIPSTHTLRDRVTSEEPALSTPVVTYHTHGLHPCTAWLHSWTHRLIPK